MSVIRAHFDGKVFVPDEPVAMPSGAKVEVIFSPPPATDRAPLAELVELLEKLPDNSNLPPDFASEVDHYLYGTPKHGNG